MPCGTDDKGQYAKLDRGKLRKRSNHALEVTELGLFWSLTIVPFNKTIF